MPHSLLELRFNYRLFILILRGMSTLRPLSGPRIQVQFHQNGTYELTEVGTHRVDVSALV